MRNATIIAVAYLLDWIAGDPEWLPHPVRLMGRCAQLVEAWLRRPGQTPLQEGVTGAALTAGVVGGAYFATEKVIVWAKKIGDGRGMEVLLAWTCLASRNLID